MRDAAFDFLGRRVFGPDRLNLLRSELAHFADTGDDERQADSVRLESAPSYGR